MRGSMSHLWLRLLLLVLLGTQSGLCLGQYGKHLGQTKVNIVPGRGYRQCGHFKCVTGQGVVCDRGANKCRCPVGNVGDGRIQCAKPDRSCLCTIHGDPHVVNFQGQDFTLPLPCYHVIADLHTPPTKKTPHGCHLIISGRAWYPSNGPKDSDVSFENQIDVFLQTKLSTFTTAINKSGFTKTYLSPRGFQKTGGKSSKESEGSWEEKRSTEKKESGGVSGKKERKSGESGSNEARASGETKRRGRRKRDTVNVYRKPSLDIEVATHVDDDGFSVVTVDACKAEIKYRASDGSFSLVTPRRSVDHKGLCGPCYGRWNQFNSTVKQFSRMKVLQFLLASLHTTNPIDHTEANIYPSCRTLTETVRNCPIGKKKHALELCGEMLTNQLTRKCMSSKLGKEHVQKTFTTCYDAICAGKRKCDALKQLFMDCDSSGHVTQYLQKNPFCRL